MASMVDGALRDQLVKRHDKLEEAIAVSSQKSELARLLGRCLRQGSRGIDIDGPSSRPVPRAHLRWPPAESISRARQPGVLREHDAYPLCHTGMRKREARR